MTMLFDFVVALCCFSISWQASRPFKRIKHDSTHPQIILELCSNGKVTELLEVFADNEIIRSNSDLARSCYKAAIKNGQTQILIALFENFGIERSDLKWGLRKCLLNRNMQLVEVLTPPAHFSDYENHELLRYAHTSVYWSYLHDQLESLSAGLGLIAASKFGNLEYFQLRSEHFKTRQEFLATIVIFLVNEGHMHILDWLMKEMGPNVYQIVQVGIMDSRRTLNLFCLMGIIEKDDVEGFNQVFEHADPTMNLPNFIEAQIAASALQLCVQYDAEKIFEKIADLLVNFHNIYNKKVYEVPSFLYLLPCLTSGINQSKKNKSAWIKRILQIELPDCFSKQIFVLEALPQALHASVLYTVPLALNDFSKADLTHLFNALGRRVRRTKLEVLYNLTQAIEQTDLSRILIFIEINPHLESIHSEIWDIIFLCSDLFVALLHTSSK